MSKRAIQKDKYKIILNKSPKIYKHIDKKMINGTYANKIFK